MKHYPYTVVRGELVHSPTSNRHKVVIPLNGVTVQLSCSGPAEGHEQARKWLKGQRKIDALYQPRPIQPQPESIGQRLAGAKLPEHAGVGRECVRSAGGRMVSIS